MASTVTASTTATTVTGTNTTMLEALLEALRKAGQFNRNAEIEPAAILWTDEERHWERLVALRLRAGLPIVTLGVYDPATRTGPAIWLRCALAGVLPDLEIDKVPILYLPGVSRAMLRAVEDCPKDLQPLAELQYRGAFFSHPNGKDWTPAAFLQFALNIPVTDGKATRDALGRALIQVSQEPLEQLRQQAPLKAAYLNELLNPDPDRRLLEWLNDPDGERTRIETADAGAWEAFRAHCKAAYGFDPVKDGELTAAAELGGREGRWKTLWARFADAPQNYPNLYDLLRRARPPGAVGLFEDAVWPQDTETGESALRDALLRLANLPAPEARAEIIRLESQHGPRRSSVWAKLNKTPLAGALEHLNDLAEATVTGLGTGTPRALAERYTDMVGIGAWKADWSAIQALASVSIPSDHQAANTAAVKAAVRAVYMPWLEAGALAFQQAIKTSEYETVTGVQVAPGGCLVFSDGLRFDVAVRLKALLEARGFKANLEWRFTALPSVTDTAKPAVSPVSSKFEAGPDLKALYKGTKVTAEVLRRALEEEGYAILRGDETGTDTTTRAWTECGDLDGLGHDQQARMAARVETEVRTIEDRAIRLLEAGWREVKIVTDHGWLLLPGGLPGMKLAEHLTDVRKGRAARLKQNASTDQQTVPWFLSGDVRIALAPGIGCYVEGREYEHGGLSVQECVVPVLSVTSGRAKKANLTLSSRWKGLRCEVKVAPADAVPKDGASVDIRTKAGDAGTSIVSAKPLGAQGSVSLVIEDDTLEGQAAIIVVLDAHGRPITQASTVVGGEP